MSSNRHSHHYPGEPLPPGSLQARGPAPILPPPSVYQPSGSVSNSHRRRGSAGYGQPVAEGPNIPRGQPRQPYNGAYPPPPVGRSGQTQSYSARLHAQPGLEDQIYKSQTRRPEYDDPVSPSSPTDRAEFSKHLIGQKARHKRRDSVPDPRDKRRGSVPDRSPLQKLEVTLDDISKEERRARVAEAEAAAQERLANDPRYYRRRPDPVRPRVASGPLEPPPQPQMAASGKRISSAPTGTPYGPPQPSAYAPAPFAQPVSRHRDESAPRRSSTGGQILVSRAYDVRRNGGHIADAAPAVATATGTAPNAARQIPTQPATAQVGRSNSRRLQKPPPQVVINDPPVQTGKEQLHVDRQGAVAGAHAARKFQAPDPLPPKAVLNHSAAGPKYELPPQTAAGQDARAQVGLGQVPPGTQTVQAHHPHLRGMLHHHTAERRYQAPGPLDEWRSAQTATLSVQDQDLEDISASQDQDSAWWEKNDRERRRSRGSRGSRTVAFDGSAESAPIAEARQTYFQPPLYVKCGPLLRYCGMRRAQSTRGHAKEVWRGTILIVTDDTQSHTQVAPSLRLFVQPQDLLPPPPVELDMASGQQLAPEYVDPLAGQVHMSRIGKTLYVRPVEQLQEGMDLSRVENDTGLFEEKPSAPDHVGTLLDGVNGKSPAHKAKKLDGEKVGKYREVKAIRLHRERNTTFWRFNIEVELGRHQTRIAYRINNGPAIGFWVPARGDTMNMMFHSCNGFSLSVDPNQFCGPDPLWRDVLNTHQTKPFHVMIGGGDQIYNDACTKHTELFREWCESRNPQFKHGAQFTVEMQEELEEFYCERYAMWFSQGLFGMANGQIPMVNVWDDHDIIDGFGSYPHHFMSSPVFTGVGAVAFKYYMLYQHHSIPDETDKEEPSWLLGSSPGPYINELSRSLFMFMGRQVAFLGLDCRTERMKDEILSQDTYDRIFERLRREIVKGETMHLIVLLGVPIAYPRLNFLENVLTSRAMDPIKALGRLGMFGGFLNKFDGGVEILDDLDDHWTAKHHKHERNWFIQELQELAAEKSVRVTILGGDVHLAAVGQFYSNKKLRIPKDQDHRYMPNIISSAIVNTPPPEMMGDILNKRNKTHHLDHDTDEDMIPLFTHDVDGKRRNNHNLLPRRNWLMIREYAPGSTPPPTPPLTPSEAPPSRRGSFGSFKLGRTLSLGRDGVTRRLSKKNPGGKPPRSFFNRGDAATAAAEPRRASDPVISRPTDGSSGYFTGIPPAGPTDPVPRPNPFHRVPTGLSEKAALRGAQMDQNVEAHINLQHGLDIVLNLEVSQHDPAGITTPYRLLVPALRYEGEGDINSVSGVRRVGLGRWLSTKIRGRRGGYKDRDVGYDSEFDSEGEMTPGPRPLSGVQQPVATLPQAAAGASQPYSYGHDGVVDATGAAHANANATAPLPQHNAMHNAIHNAVHNTSHSASHNAAHNISHNTSHNGALAQIGPDGRPVRTRFRGDLYQEAEPARVADEADEYSDLDTPGPRPQAAVGNGRGIGYGYGGVEQPVVKKKPNWKIWR